MFSNYKSRSSALVILQEWLPRLDFLEKNFSVFALLENKGYEEKGVPRFGVTSDSVAKRIQLSERSVRVCRSEACHFSERLEA